MVPTPTIISGSPDSEKGNYVMTPRHSMTVTNTKGLLNMPGQNNCFLNSAVQVLWHLDIFRRSFRELLGHACMGESCIFCALKELFTQFQYSQESALPPDALRHALAKTFCDQRRFQLGFMDDAAECFENILLRIHVHIGNQEHEDMCGDARCIPHQKFAMTLVEQPVCHNCGATSEPLPFTQMVHYVTTSALCSIAQENQNYKSEFRPSVSFGKLLKQAGDMGEVRDCQGGCGSKIHMRKTLMNHPEIVSVGLVWDSECPSLQHITDVFQSIGMYLRLQDMFHAVIDTEWANSTSHELVGVVTYYGKHYSTFFFHTKLRVWIYFDDAAVREIGPSWEQVVEKCQKGRFQPLLLLFANPNGTSLSPTAFHHDQLATLKPGTKSSPNAVTQRQAVINQYLAFQNFMQNGNPMTTGTLHQNDFSYLNQQGYPGSEANLNFSKPKPNHLYQMRNQVLPTTKCFQCGQSSSHSVYNRCKCSSDQAHSFSNSQSVSLLSEKNASQAQPIYSNSQMFRNSAHVAPFHHGSKDISKANEAALPPILTPKLPARNNLQPFVQMNASAELHQVNSIPKPQEYHSKTENKDLIDHSKDSDSAYAEDDPENSDIYISRKAVENVLNQQKLRQISLSRPYSHGTVGNRNSSSSLESFDNIHSNKLANIQKDGHVLDPETVRIRRDSGNWSSDRNSSSSLSNSSVDNSFLAVIASKRLLLGLNNCHVPGGKSQLLPDFSNASNSDHGYDSYSVSSSDSYPSVTGSPVKLDPRLTLIPEDWQGQDSLSDLDKKLLMITEESLGPPDCDKLCAEADLLLAKSHDKEKEGDLIMAALLSDSAAARARTAMDAPYNNSRSLVSAKMKHSTCVMRSSCLYRRIKDNEAEERRKQKGMSGHHSRQSSRDSTHGRHSRQGSKDGTATKQTKKESSNQTADENDTLGRNIEIYGTLPKKGSRRKLMSPTGSSKAKDEQIYEDFLDKQRKNISGSGSLSDHSPKSSKLPGKLENSKSKAEASEKQSKKSASSEMALPKSPMRKTREAILDGNSEDFKNTSHAKKHNLKSSSVDHSSMRNSFTKETDLSNDDEMIGKDLLSPIDSSTKKQHKIKRKLMGGFMKRKNRSLPDLREDQDLSDTLDRSFDDSSIQMSPTLTLPNGKLKKMDYQPDPTVNGVTRGFHQPHYAFVKKDLSHRPLLMKVNPPNIQPTTSLSNLKSKPIHTLPSLPKKIPEPKSKATSEPEIECKPTRTSLLCIPQIDAPVPPLRKTAEILPTPVVPPLRKTAEILPTPVVPPLRNSSIPSLIPHSNLTVARNKLNVAEVQMASPPPFDSSGSKDELPLPANPFLAELQAKRHQIIGASDQNKKGSSSQESDNKQKQTLLPSLKEVSSQRSNLTSNSEGKSWLQELQNKQQQMLRKQVAPPVVLPKAGPNECQEVSKNMVKRHDSVNNSKSAENSEVKKAELERRNECTKSLPSKDSEKAADDVKDNSSNNTVSSVKNLASRFEKILKNPTSLNGSTSKNASNTTNGVSKSSSNPTFLPPTTIPNSICRRTETNISQAEIRDVELEETRLTASENGNTEPLSYSQIGCPVSERADIDDKIVESQEIKQPVIHSESDSLPVEVDGEDVVDGKSFLPQCRPQAPPDYETALQRLELIRTAPPGELSRQVENEISLPPILSSSAVSTTLTERKRQGPKKTVTFSDEVVLVACADFEDDFLPNPLLERVYQQQSESGRVEESKYDLPPDYRTQPCENTFSYGNYQSQSPENTAKPTSNSSLQGTVSCHLCHNKYVVPPVIYCEDCEFYMSRFQA